MANVENNNKIFWNKTSEIEPPGRTRLWVCRVSWRFNSITNKEVKKYGKHKKIRLDSWDPVSKTWNHDKNTDTYEYVYWTYPIYPEVR